jgi:rhodanese-related sulfurtransferase
MAPFDPTALGHWGTNAVNVAIGVGFGFVLERAGFGNSRKLAAQFYLGDQSVLKVMFTAIVTAMVLVFWSSAAGLLDFEAVWVNPTYLWPGIIGGLLLGVGFIIGGYCPGTSVVATATLKLDGLLFLLGCLSGIFVFGETVEWHRAFWEQAGFMGRLTIPEWLGLSNGTVVLLVVLMALGMFAGAEYLESIFGASRGGVPAAPGRQGIGRVMRSPRLAGAAGLLLAAGLLAVVPDAGQRRLREAVDRQMADRSLHVDPAELLTLMHNHDIKLRLLDVRGEAEFNRFHLLDAIRVGPGVLDGPVPGESAPDVVKVVMADDEAGAEQAARALMLRRAPSVYVLAGGINGWLARFGSAPCTTKPSAVAQLPGPSPASALGSRYAAAMPPVSLVAQASFAHKVRLLGPMVKKSGGCGG